MSQLRQDRHKKQKTKVTKYKNVDYPPHEAPIYISDERATEDTVLPDGATLRKRPPRPKKQTANNATNTEQEDTQDIDLDELYTQDYDYNENKNYLFRIIITALVVAILGVGSFAAITIRNIYTSTETNTTKTNTIVTTTANNEALVNLTNLSVDDSLADYKEQLLSLRKELYALLVFHGRESTSSTRIIKSTTDTELAPNTDILKTLNVDMSKDLAANGSNAVRTQSAESYIFSFVRSNAVPAKTADLLQKIEQLETPNVDATTQGFQALYDARNQLNIQTNITQDKITFEQTINQWTQKPVIRDDELYLDDLILLINPSDADLENAENAVRAINEASPNQAIIVEAYRQIIVAVKKQANLIKSIEQGLVAEAEKPSQRNLVDLKNRIEKLPDTDLKQALIDDWQTLQNKIDDQKQIENKEKELADEKEKAKKDAQDEISEIRETSQKELDAQKKSYEQQLSQQETTLRSNYQTQLDELMQELNDSLSRNKELQQQNDALLQQLQQLQHQLDQLTIPQGSQ